MEGIIGAIISVVCVIIGLLWNEVSRWFAYRREKILWECHRYKQQSHSATWHTLAQFKHKQFVGSIKDKS
jgi:hypothetical protein